MLVLIDPWKKHKQNKFPIGVQFREAAHAAVQLAVQASNVEINQVLAFFHCNKLYLSKGAS